MKCVQKSFRLPSKKRGTIREQAHDGRRGLRLSCASSSTQAAFTCTQTSFTLKAKARGTREREREKKRERERERERGYILSIPLTFFIFIFNFIFNFVFVFGFGFQKGCHLVTGTIEEQLSPLLKGVSCGMCNVFLQHTSASLTINENADPSVRVDMETFLNLVVPEGYSDIPWTHTMEGKDDMPAHCKSSMFGASLNIPVTNGRLALGTWQGIWLCEHRDHATPRSIVCTVTGA